MKRIMLTAVGLAVVLGLLAAGGYVFAVRGTPDWLRRPLASEAERAAAANSMDQKIIQTLSMVREMDAARSAGSAAPGDRRPSATQPAAKLEVSFTEDELNASFQKWDQLYGWTDRYKDYVQDPSIILHDGRIVIAGRSDEIGTIVSLHFDPKLDRTGQLDLRLSHVLAGRLPLPHSFFDKYRQKTRSKLHTVLPDLQRRAELRPDGSANQEAMSAAMAKLFLRVLENEPGEPALFLPVGQQGSVPVKLTGVRIHDKELTLTVKPMNASERVALLERIRERYDKETAMRTQDAPIRQHRGS